MILRDTKGYMWDTDYPWSIRTFLAFAAAEGILLDLVILRSFENVGGGGWDAVSNWLESRSQMTQPTWTPG